MLILHSHFTVFQTDENGYPGIATTKMVIIHTNIRKDASLKVNIEKKKIKLILFLEFILNSNKNKALQYLFEKWNTNNS